MTSPRDTEADSHGPQEPRVADASPAQPSAEEAPATEQESPRPREPEAVPPEAVSPAAVPPRREERTDAGPGWSSDEQSARATSPAAGQDATTVLPAGARRPPTPPAAAGRLAAPAARTTSRPLAGRSRRARLTLRRIDPWSVFLFSLVASVFIGVAMVVAVAVMYAVLGSLGVTESLNELYVEVTGGDITTDALITSGRIVGGAAVLAAVNVVFLTLLATLSSLLYNLCSSFTGGIELTFGERD